MAVGPNTENTEDDLNVARELEATIDQEIRARYDGEQSFPVSLPIFPRAKVRQILTNKYISSGWGSMTWYDDQRDGTYILLNLPSPATGRD